MAEVEYKSNSHKSKEKAKEKKEDTRAKLRKNKKNKPTKPEPRKSAWSVIFDDLFMIAMDTKDEVIIPGIYDLVENMWYGFSDSIFEKATGRPASSRSKKSRKSSYHAYDGHYNGGSSSSKKSRRSNKPRKINYGRYSIYEVPLETEKLAEDVIDAMFEQLDDERICKVKDYYDFADFQDWSYTDYPGDWGWMMDEDDEYPFDIDELIDSIEEIRVNGERMYTITGLPKPVRLD